MGEIWEKIGNPISFERVMGPNRHNIENYGELQPIAQNMEPTLWVKSENLSFGFLPYVLFPYSMENEIFFSDTWAFSYQNQI